MHKDALAERLRRWPAKPFPYGSVSSSLTGVDFYNIIIILMYILIYIIKYY